MKAPQSCDWGTFWENANTNYYGRPLSMTLVTVICHQF